MSICINCGSRAHFHEQHNPLATYCNHACHKQDYLDANVKFVSQGNSECGLFTEIGTFRIDNNKTRTLFLGRRPDRRKEVNEIVVQNIKTVISVTDNPTSVEEVSSMQKNGVTVFNFPIKDARPTDIDVTRLQFDAVAREITRGLKRGNVLIHCDAGCSRSPAFLVYWLMKNHVFTSIEQARNFLASNRLCVRPVEDWFFIDFLRRWWK